MLRAARAAVSGPRTRIKVDGYDLDMTYITPRIIAMGLPASGMESAYRNPSSEVASFLSERHGSQFMIFNLSQRSYDISKFGGRVMDCGFPDHRPPTLNKLCAIVHSMGSWLDSDAENVAVVHCKAGKGRTGLVIAAYLIMFGGIPGDEAGKCTFGSEPEIATVDTALEGVANLAPLLHDEHVADTANRMLEYFRERRGEGVSYAGQQRYCKYFVLVAAMTPAGRDELLLNPKCVRIDRISLRGLPPCDPLLQVVMKEQVSVFVSCVLYAFRMCIGVP